MAGRQKRQQREARNTRSKGNSSETSTDSSRSDRPGSNGPTEGKSKNSTRNSRGRKSGVAGKRKGKATSQEDTQKQGVNKGDEVQAPKTKNTSLKPEEKLFANAYAAHFDGPRAVRDAGIQVKNAYHKSHQLLNRQDVLDEIDRNLATKREEIKVEEKDIIKGLYDEATNYENGSSATRINAWRELGKLMGLYHRVENEAKKEMQNSEKELQPQIINYSDANDDSPTNEERTEQEAERKKREELEQKEIEEAEIVESRGKYNIMDFSEE